MYFHPAILFFFSHSHLFFKYLTSYSDLAFKIWLLILTFSNSHLFFSYLTYRSYFFNLLTVSSHIWPNKLDADHFTLGSVVLQPIYLSPFLPSLTCPSHIWPMHSQIFYYLHDAFLLQIIFQKGSLVLAPNTEGHLSLPFEPHVSLSFSSYPHLSFTYLTCAFPFYLFIIYFWCRSSSSGTR